MDKGKVTIAVMVNNHRDYLMRCLNSILDQTYKNVEVMCCCYDCSDDSKDVLQAVCNKGVKIFDAENQVQAKNTAIKTATGKYIMFVNDYDELNVQAIENLMEYATDKTDIIIGGVQYSKDRNNAFLLPSKQNTFSVNDEKSFYDLCVYSQNCLSFLPRMYRVEKITNTYNYADYFGDLHFFYNYLQNCDMISCVPAIVYYFAPTPSPEKSYNKLTEKMGEFVNDIYDNVSTVVKKLFSNNKKIQYASCAFLISFAILTACKIFKEGTISELKSYLSNKTNESEYSEVAKLSTDADVLTDVDIITKQIINGGYDNVEEESSLSIENNKQNEFDVERFEETIDRSVVMMLLSHTG